MRLPATRMSRGAQSLVPDGLEHPKYKARRSVVGYYITCWKDAVEQLAERGTNYIMFAQRSPYCLDV